MRVDLIHLFRFIPACHTLMSSLTQGCEIPHGRWRQRSCSCSGQETAAASAALTACLLLRRRMGKGSWTVFVEKRQRVKTWAPSSLFSISYIWLKKEKKLYLFIFTSLSSFFLRAAGIFVPIGEQRGEQRRGGEALCVFHFHCKCPFSFTCCNSFCSF